MNSRSVLLVEDDRFLSTVVKARLEKAGIPVLQAFDGDEALKLLQGQPPEGHPALIILDLILPKTTGFEVLRTISNSPELKKIPIVVLSHLAQETDIQKAKEMGAKEYFVKVKISIDDLVAKIKELSGWTID